MNFLSIEDNAVIRQAEQLGLEGLEQDPVLREKIRRLMEKISLLQSATQRELDRYAEYLALAQLKRIGLE
jgi:hypothetical protein